MRHLYDLLLLLSLCSLLHIQTTDQNAKRLIVAFEVSK